MCLVMLRKQQHNPKGGYCSDIFALFMKKGGFISGLNGNLIWLISAYIRKFNAQYPNTLASSTVNRLYAVNVGKHLREKHVRSHPVKCKKLATALFHYFQRPGSHGLASEAMIEVVIYVPAAFLTTCSAMAQLGSCEAHCCVVNQFKNVGNSSIAAYDWIEDAQANTMVKT